jgi:hypothetical protein
MVGKLMLNPRYLIFHAYEARYSGVFQAGRLSSTGQVLSIALDTIVDVVVESGVRAKRSRPNWKNKEDFEKKVSGERAINTHPGMLDEPERYSTLMLTIETETEGGVEIARFEVQNPGAWEQTLKSQLTKSTS